MRCAVPILSLGLLCAPSGSQTPNWHQTSSETVWIARYSNCDHGYYVLLPQGVVAHNSLPPSPNHGFEIELSNPSSTSPANLHSTRAIWIWDSLGFTESGSVTPEQLEAERSKEPRGSGSLHFLRRTFLRVGGEKAVQIRYSLRNKSTDLLEDDIEVFSPDAQTEYQFRLVTPKANYNNDRHSFDQVVAGFHFTPVLGGGCSNN